jgi:hypothetical protein
MAAVHPSQDAAVADDCGWLDRLIADTISLVVWSACAGASEAPPDVTSAIRHGISSVE